MVAMVRRGMSSQLGYALALTLFFAVVLAVLLFTLAQLWEGESRRERERQLLWVGGQFQRALASYLTAPGVLSGEGPKSIDELISDKRFDPPMRHLRRVYADPMTNTTEWGFKRTSDGAIIGIHSMLKMPPLKSDGLWPEPKEFAAAKSYEDWVFTARFVVRTPVAPQTQPVTQ